MYKLQNAIELPDYAIKIIRIIIIIRKMKNDGNENHPTTTDRISSSSFVCTLYTMHKKGESDPSEKIDKSVRCIGP